MGLYDHSMWIGGYGEVTLNINTLNVAEWDIAITPAIVRYGLRVKPLYLPPPLDESPQNWSA